MPVCLDPLQRKAREAWGFKGYVTSDSDAVGDGCSSHSYASCPNASCLAIKAGRIHSRQSTLVVCGCVACELCGSGFRETVQYFVARRGAPGRARTAAAARVEVVPEPRHVELEHIPWPRFDGVMKKCDIDSGNTYYHALASGVAGGMCSVADVDGALFNSFRVRFDLGERAATASNSQA